jgi:hypothetical protein
MLYMLTKEIVTAQIESMENEFSLDELIERLIIVEKVEKGLIQLKEGRTNTDEELDKIMSEWFK